MPFDAPLGLALLGVTFDDPWFLLALLALPVALWWTWRGSRKPGALRHPQVDMLRRVTPAWVRYAVKLPDVLRAVALAAFIVALARPQTSDLEVLSGEGVDIVVALDMSASMNAVDVSRDELQEVLDANELPKNRFEIARATLVEFIQNRREDRVGLVVFGEKAFLKFPLTLDYSRVLSLLAGLVLDNGERMSQDGDCTNNCTISGAGTAIGDALSRAYLRLRDSKAKSRVIALITDGKNEGGKVQPKTIADYIASRPEDEQVRIYTFQVGNDKETYVPTRGPFGRVTYQPPQRPFPTDPELLRYIAEKTGGAFYESYNEEQFRKDFGDLVKTTFETKTYTKHRDVFSPFVVAGALVLMLELLLRFGPLRKFP